MKNKLNKAEIKFIKFDTDDIITTSTEPMGGQGQNEEGGYGPVIDLNQPMQ